MCFSLSLWCSRKGEENGKPPGPGKVLFTGCMSTQTLERGICFYTYKAVLLRATSDEAGMILPLLQGCFTQGARGSSAGTPSPAAFLHTVWSSTI